MSLEIKVPMLPESVTEAVVAVWHKQEGDLCAMGDVIAELETDKVMLEVVATEDGKLQKQNVSEGDTVGADTVLAILDIEAQSTPVKAEEIEEVVKTDGFVNASPSIRREIHDKNIDTQSVTATGRGGRITEADLDAVTDMANQPKMAREPETASQSTTVEPVAVHSPESHSGPKRVKMSRLRAKIAERLLDAQHSCAMLTTFNEVNMAPVMALRQDYQPAFVEKYGVKLGFMSFFVHAVTEALAAFPEVNASVDGEDILYHLDANIGIAVSTERGLVVPVLQQAQKMNYAEVEQKIRDYADKARQGKISLADMQGGTFTITNGGVFGSLVSTPILNMPQSAILGMHTIQKRPVVENDEIVIRPMMYLALTYDHRLIDGKQSVSFLVKVKELIENPIQSLIGL